MAASFPARFAGKTAVVTGGSGGIGAACVRRLHAEGARVAILDLADEAGAKLRDELTVVGAENRAEYFHCNVASEADVEAVFARVAAELGPVDVLICMAAVFLYGEVHLASEATWDRSFAVNVKGPAFCAKAVLPSMRERRCGSIVLTSSITGVTAFPAFVPYSATKAAVLQMVRDMALDNGPHGVRVNAVAPGPIFTEGGTVAHARSEGSTVDDVCAELARDVALRRMGTVDECAAATVFLASPDAAFVTGTTLHCDGGFFRK
jgi:NAD(P)-dependent dehydrogenase (short-subunit alcohol dehydrogenase family)